jgi:Zn-dependent protease
VQPLNFRSRNGNAIVSWSGPAVNLVLAAIGLLLAGLAFRAGAGSGLRLFLLVFGQWNIVLFLFNMIPIPPLDGSQVVADASPRYAQWIRDPGAQPFFMVAMAVLFLFAGRYLFRFASIVAEAVVGAIAG